MLPIVLYNNMEGSTNNPNSSFGNYDENVILNCVRTRKKVSELPNCPVCSCTIRQGELESHLNLEVERLQKLSSSGGKRKLSATSPGGLAVPGSSTDPDLPDEDCIDVSGCPGSDVYQRVHKNRVCRLRARRRSPPPAQGRAGECPICNVSLPVARLQRHALRCLKRTGANIDEDVPDTSSEDGSIDVENDEPLGGFGAEYQWCGEWRVRASALMPAAALGAPARRVSTDQALVVDGDEDTELYGPPQYSPSRIHPDAEITPAEEVETEDHHMPAENGTEVDRIAENSIEDNKPDREEAPSKYNGLVEASAETRIQALKAKIKELESKQTGGSEAKCLICLGCHVSPTVSIQCWHVYCEICWLQSLRAKKICPQCNAITTAAHLRRIYM